MLKQTQETAKLSSERSESTDEPLVLRVFADENAISFPLPSRGEVTIGRSRDADIQLPDATSLSRKHAALDIGPRLRLRDLDSSNGTFFLRKRIPTGQSVELRPGEVFELGDVMM